MPLPNVDDLFNDEEEKNTPPEEETSTEEDLFEDEAPATEEEEEKRGFELTARDAEKLDEALKRKSIAYKKTKQRVRELEAELERVRPKSTQEGQPNTLPSSLSKEEILAELREEQKKERAMAEQQSYQDNIRKEIRKMYEDGEIKTKEEAREIEKSIKALPNRTGDASQDVKTSFQWMRFQSGQPITAPQMGFASFSVPGGSSYSPPRGGEEPPESALELAKRMNMNVDEVKASWARRDRPSLFKDKRF